VSIVQTCDWITTEFRETKFPDLRLKKRFIKIMNAFSSKPSASIPLAFNGDWGATKAAYRFFHNKEVPENEIMGSHREQTLSRIPRTETVFAIQDTTYFEFNHHPKKEGLSKLGSSYGYDNYGVLLHGTMAVSEQGVPYGMLDLNVFCRKKAEVNHKLLPIEKKESYRWITPLKKISRTEKKIVVICDREADIHEFFEECEKEKLFYLNRVQKNRILLDEKGHRNGETLVDYIRNSKVKGQREIVVEDSRSRTERLVLFSISYERVTLRAPQRQGTKRGSPVEATVIRASEEGGLESDDRIEWIFLTNLNVESLDDAVEKISWYKKRWHIENFFKVLKSNCRIEDCRLGHAEKIKRFILLKSVIAYRLYFLTHIGRVRGKLQASSVLSRDECSILNLKFKGRGRKNTLSLDEAIILIGKLGGYLARESDPPPGVILLGRGLEELSRLVEGYKLFMGNS